MQLRTGRAHSPLVILLPALGWFAPTHVESFSFFYHGSTADTIALPMASSCSQRSEPQRFPGVSIFRGRSRVMSRAAASPLASSGRKRSSDGSSSALTRRLSSETATEQETSSVRRLQKSSGETETVTSSTSRTKPKILGPKRIGDVEDEGFSGTRVGFHTLKEYEIPQEAPMNLPEGEERGYPMLLYQFMHAQYPDDFPSQSSSRKAVRRKELLLNGEEVRNDSKVQPGDVITSQKRVQPGLFPQGKPSCKLPVLWEDDFIAVVVKPPGVAVHGDTGPDGPGPNGRRSVRQSLPYILTPTKSLDRPLHRPLHCHRLDKPTGGLLVCAKTRPALSAMNDAFEKRLVSKRYVALVSGMLEGSGSIVTALDDKPCVTNFRARDGPVRSLRTDYITTVDLWPVTGRFHQLRRHLASIGNPILGDDRYSDEDLSSTPHQRQGGMFLQAVGLTFPHPITGEELRFFIPEPAKFGRWRKREHQRWIEHHEAETNTDRGGVSVNQGMDDNVPGSDTPRSPNAVPEVEGLEIQERDGFRYYQYDWDVVGGPPSPLSLKDIDETVDDP